MTHYELLLHDERDRPVEHLEFDGVDDDQAIEHAGRIDHPLRMIVRDGERIVAHFAPRVGVFRFH